MKMKKGGGKRAEVEKAKVDSVLRSGRAARTVERRRGGRE